MLLLMSVFCITLFASCGSEAYKECKKSYSEFEKRLKKATTEEEMVKATECYIGRGDLDLMTNDEQYKIKNWRAELADLWDEKIVSFCPGTYTYTSDGNNYKLVVDADDDAYNGHASLYKNGSLLSNEGSWSIYPPFEDWNYQILVEFPAEKYVSFYYYDGEPCESERYYDVVINVLHPECDLKPTQTHSAYKEHFGYFGGWPCTKQ